MISIHLDGASRNDVLNIIEAVGFPDAYNRDLDEFIEEFEDPQYVILHPERLNNWLKNHYQSLITLFGMLARDGFVYRHPESELYTEVIAFLVRGKDSTYRVWVSFPVPNYAGIGKIASMLRDYGSKLEKAMVRFNKSEGEVFTIKAIAAICACHVAGAHAACQILSDMARDEQI